MIDIHYTDYIFKYFEMVHFTNCIKGFFGQMLKKTNLFKNYIYKVRHECWTVSLDSKKRQKVVLKDHKN